MSGGGGHCLPAQMATNMADQHHGHGGWRKSYTSWHPKCTCSKSRDFIHPQSHSERRDMAGPCHWELYIRSIPNIKYTPNSEVLIRMQNMMNRFWPVSFIRVCRVMQDFLHPQFHYQSREHEPSMSLTVIHALIFQP